jgi:hypothetical protein
MKKLIFTAKIISIISLILILILWPIFLITSNSGITNSIQYKNTIQFSYTSPEDAKYYNNQIISFITGKNIDLNFLSSNEISHLKDVRNLVVVGNLILIISIFLLSIIMFLKISLKKVFRNVSIFVSIFLVLTLIFTVFAFQFVFQSFHKIFFTGNYAFSQSSMLKILYPDSFFRDVFILYFIMSILGCAITFVISYKLKA